MNIEQILSMEPMGADRYIASSPSGTGRTDIFGGQVAGQALRAGSLTVASTKVPNSIHSYFLRRGRPDLPLEIRVERVRDGRTYANRRIQVIQDGKVIFEMAASFHSDEPGREVSVPMPSDVADPDELVSAERVMALPFEIRNVDEPAPGVRWWGRFPGPMSDDPFIRCSALLYASDMRAGGAAITAIGFEDGPDAFADGSGPPKNFGSLDHSLWFHQVPTLDDWFFCDVRPVAVRDSRGLVFGKIYERSGRQLASFVQEMFLKVFEGEPIALDDGRG